MIENFFKKPKQREFYFTSESVTEGHPDKVCDCISDGILDGILSLDSEARVACETMASAEKIIISGEISTSLDINKEFYINIARKTLNEIGYSKNFGDQWTEYPEDQFDDSDDEVYSNMNRAKDTLQEVFPVKLSELNKKRVLEALRHLPRPAILYVTEREEAELWKNILKNEGYKNFQMIHGGSRDEDREKTVKEWKTGNLDLVIGTSAFGLGIDYQHARSVIHACIPEGISRYYQEIGRTGRDNRASIALLLPANSDFNVAEELARKRIISIEKGYKRWEKMFHEKKPFDEDRVILVDTSIAPPYEEFMFGQSNDTWNQRVLNLLSIAGFIKLKGTYYDPEEEKSLMQVEIIEDGHLTEINWDEKVSSIRQRIIQSSDTGFEFMKDLLKNEICPSELFERVYHLEQGQKKFDVKKACGGCKYCRKNHEGGWFTEQHEAPESVWDIGKVKPGYEWLFPQSRLFVEWNEELFGNNEKRRSNLRKFKSMFHNFWDIGIHKCIVVGRFRKEIREILEEKPWCVVNGIKAHIMSGSGLPSGPEIIWIEKGVKLAVHHLNNKNGTKRIFFIPNDFKDPSNPGDLFSERHSVTPYEIFRTKINS